MSQDEIRANRKSFIDISGQVLVLISNRNPKQSKRLVSIIESNRGESDAENKLNADALVKYAISLAEENPELAAEMGALALRIGQPSTIYELYWKLSKSDRELSAKLFDAILRSASANPNISMANAVKLAAFPELVIPTFPDGQKSSASQKTRALEFLLGYLIGQKNKFDSGQIETCSTDGYLLLTLLPQFALFIPAKSGIVNEAVEHCLRAKPENSRPPDLKLGKPSEITVESLLKLADEVTADPDKRAYYLFRAASLANDQKKFEKAIAILEGMNEDEIKTDRGLWDSLRYTTASGLAYEKVGEQDFVGASSVLDKVPESIRAFARIGFGLKCSSSELSVRQLCASHLETGVRELSKSTKGIAEKSGFGMHAVKKLVEFDQPSEALTSLEAIVKAINSDQSEKKENPFHLTQDLYDSAIDAGFLGSYDQSILSSIEKLSDTESKINGFISFTKTALGRASDVARNTKVN